MPSNYAEDQEGGITAGGALSAGRAAFNLAGGVGGSSALAGVAPTVFDAGQVFAALPATGSATAAAGLGTLGAGTIFSAFGVANFIAGLLGITPFTSHPDAQIANIPLNLNGDSLGKVQTKNAGSEQIQFAEEYAENLRNMFNAMAKKEGYEGADLSSLALTTEFGRGNIGLRVDGRTLININMVDLRSNKDLDAFTQQIANYYNYERLNMNSGYASLGSYQSYSSTPYGNLRPGAENKTLLNNMGPMNIMGDINKANSEIDVEIVKHKKGRTEYLEETGDYDLSGIESFKTIQSTGDKDQPLQSGMSAAGAGLLNEANSVVEATQNFANRRSL